MWKQSAFCREKTNKSKDFAILGIKQCLHPNNEECSEKIIGAHSIQNNKILKEMGIKVDRTEAPSYDMFEL